MISRIALKNFRRIEELELTFDPSHQLIVITGANGTGKSAILESIAYALFSETRNGRGGLDSIIRRGAEFEGTDVTLELTLEGIEYRIDRHRERGLSSALLWRDGEPWVEGPAAVNAAVRDILGMDWHGFKLATYSGQRELAGLVSLAPRERVEQLGKLLRLDVLKRASMAAGARARSATDIVKFLHQPDIVSFEHTLAQGQALVSGLETSIEEALGAAASIEDQLLVFAEAEKRWVSGQANYQLTCEVLQQAQTKELEWDLKCEGLRANQLNLDDVENLSSLLAKRDAIELDLMAYQRGVEKQLRHQRSLDEFNQSLKEIEAARAILDQTSSVILEANLITLKDTQAQYEATHLPQAQLELDAAKLHAALRLVKLEEIEKRQERLNQLGAVCETCGQQIASEHKHAQAHQSTSEQTQAAKELEDAQHKHRLSHLEQARLIVLNREILGQITKLTARIGLVREAESALSGAERRKTVWQSELEDVPQASLSETHQQDLLSQRTIIASAITQWQRSQVADKEWRGAEAAREEASKRVQELSLKLEGITQDIEAQQAHQKCIALRAQQADEEALAQILTTELAGERERANAASERLSEALNLAFRRHEQVELARIALLTRDALGAAHTKLSGDMRPALEASASDLLERMSEGRFTGLRLTPDYEPQVNDNNRWVPLGECSGGESDQIALALRLSLAQVVQDRRGDQGAGFLILDEIFGFLDAARRESTLATLRHLKTIYGQVFAVSHVGGLEDLADLVVSLEARPDGVTQVTVL